MACPLRQNVNELAYLRIRRVKHLQAPLAALEKQTPKHAEHVLPYQDQRYDPAVHLSCEVDLLFTVALGIFCGCL